MLAAYLLLLIAADSLFVSAPNGAVLPMDEFRGTKATVIAFTSVRCPISGMYQQRLNQLYRDFSAKGVVFAVLNSNSNETLQEVSQRTQEAALPYSVYKDFHNRVADLYGVQTTPEVVILDPAGSVRYKGAIDDSSNEARVKTHAARDALNALLAGKNPPVANLKAFGCVLKREKK